jgi:hypothetical protein
MTFRIVMGTTQRTGCITQGKLTSHRAWKECILEIYPKRMHPTLEKFQSCEEVWCHSWIFLEQNGVFYWLFSWSHDPRTFLAFAWFYSSKKGNKTVLLNYWIKGDGTMCMTEVCFTVSITICWKVSMTLIRLLHLVESIYKSYQITTYLLNFPCGDYFGSCNVPL